MFRDDDIQDEVRNGVHDAVPGRSGPRRPWLLPALAVLCIAVVTIGGVLWVLRSNDSDSAQRTDLQLDDAAPSRPGPGDVQLEVRDDFAVDDDGALTADFEALVASLIAEPDVEAADHQVPQVIRGIVPDAEVLTIEGHLIKVHLRADAGDDAAAEIAARYHDHEGVTRATVN